MYLLTAGSTSQSLAAWGFELGTITLQNQAPDTLTLHLPAARAAAADPIPYGTIVTLDHVVGSTTRRLFYGIRVAAQHTLSGSTDDRTYTFAGPWWWLEQLVFHQVWQAWDGSALADTYNPHLILNISSPAGEYIPTNTQLTEIINYAAAAPRSAPIQVGTISPSVYLPLDEATDITCAEAIRRTLRLCPDAIVHFDYTTSPPTLHIQRDTELAQVTLDTTELDTLGVAKRDDLELNAVVIRYEIENTIDGNTYLQSVFDAYPAGSLSTDLGVFPATVPIAGLQRTTERCPVTSVAIEPTDPDWWTARGLLDPNLSNLVTVTLDPATLERETDLPYELTAGSISDWIDFVQAPDTITINATINVYADTGHTRLLHTYTQVLSAQVTATDAPTGDYTGVTQVDAESVPTGLAQYLYEASGGYDGQFAFTASELDPRPFMGRAINLTGGQPDWTTMRAPVQSVTLDLASGATQVKFGPARHLAITDIISLLRVNRVRRVITNKTARTAGLSGSSATIAHPSATPNRNATVATPSYSQLTIGNDQTGAQLTQAGALQIKANNALRLDASITSLPAGSLATWRTITVCVNIAETGQPPNWVQKTMLVLGTEPV
jgi:hypothetical protein